MLHEVINILLTVETSAHNEAQFLHIQEINVQEINVQHQISYQTDVCRISCKCDTIDKYQDPSLTLSILTVDGRKRT